MLSALLLMTHFASAQVACTPASTDAKDKGMVVCGTDRVATYTNKTQKADSVTVIFKDNKKGAEKSMTFKKPGLTVEQINNGQFEKSPAINKEIGKVKKEWKLKDVKLEVSRMELADSTLYATADLKTKATIDKLKKINRAVASDAAPIAGGIRGVSGK